MLSKRAVCFYKVWKYMGKLPLLWFVWFLGGKVHDLVIFYITGLFLQIIENI